MNELLTKEVIELGFGDSLKQVLISNGYTHLNQLLEISPEELMEIRGLTLAHISEYKRFLIANKLQANQKDF